ncbi:serine palmitoyltransferase small subunit B [Falco rusticolus]|uniref:serine palmitoyltransferase small subunit B n=1 Tax=Falco rusticolus TaxID=120794 RepID=UPI0018865071|nr:serine palmitoyltransferase small subunit B [Falco rusticolus]XP_037263515.1 serine palmitoyltransferase small subunit B [Falco rusticolus]XP_037263516.1 serine palmitoyltransferase small subunit B [Falco rusticolus]XP_037263517.1 serine palmitoyltransferase small subunit B [Falco rusticolus]
MDIKHVKDYIYWLYYQYLLITCSYVLEPWERSMFHTITVTVFAMVVYTAYVFVPIHVCLAFEFFSQIFGEQPESTVSIVN